MKQNSNQEYRAMIPETPDRNSRKKRTGLGKTFALALICILIGGAFTSCGGDDSRKQADSPAEETEVTETAETTENEEETESAVSEETQEAPAALASTMAAVTSARKLMSASEVYAANVNSTVGITTSINTNYFGYRTTAAAAGSGFIITPDGYIVTNYHVVEDSSSISVALFDGTAYEAELVGADESNDVAVLKVDAQNLTPVTLGDSDQTLVGEDVIAIGNPLGELTFSLTKGVISALDREITLSTGVTMNLMQTDCAINSGNSGGPLFNLYGEVIGITNAKYSSSGFGGEASIDNIGFAIPMNSVAGIVKSIMENGYVKKPYIGVSVDSVSEEMQKYGVPAGASVQNVEENSPAAKAGIQVNDIITEANGQAVTSSSDLSKIVTAASAGDTIKMKLYRQGKALEITVTVGEKEQTTETAPAADEGGSQKPGSNGGHDHGGSGGSSNNDGYDNYDGYNDYGGSGGFGDFFGFGNGGNGFGDIFGDGGLFDWFFGSGDPYSGGGSYTGSST